MSISRLDIASSRRPTRKGGSPARRRGPRTTRPDYHGASALTLADYAMSRQHAADFGDRGHASALEPNGVNDAEVWQVAERRTGLCHHLWRKGARYAVRFQWTAELSTVRTHRTLDGAWNDLRRVCALPEAVYAAEAAHAATIVASLPAWLTVSAG